MRGAADAFLSASLASCRRLLIILCLIYSFEFFKLISLILALRLILA